MDPADPVHRALSRQGTVLGQYDQILKALFDSNQSVSTHVSELSRQVATLASTMQTMPAPALPRDSHVSDPDPFFGDLDKCRGFLLQCGLVFQQRPVSFSSDVAKLNYVIGLLRGRALAWAEAVSAVEDFSRMSYSDFVMRVNSVRPSSF